MVGKNKERCWVNQSQRWMAVHGESELESGEVHWSSCQMRGEEAVYCRGQQVCGQYIRGARPGRR